MYLKMINFETVQLFDVEGNKVFVNSFEECQHYVSGVGILFPTK